MTEPTPLSAAGLGEEDALRANAYTLLGHLLAQAPDAGMLALLRSIQIPEAAASLMAEAWRGLRQAAESAESADLDDEYFQLFIGIGQGELVPYGSWYLTGFLMEKPLAELRLDLARLGIERRDGVREPEDHAAALCETMGMIITDPTIPFGMQRLFFEKHLAPWLGRFFRDLGQTGSARFYRAVGLVGERFMEIEAKYLAMTV